jgi:general secretion pathway protein I
VRERGFTLLEVMVSVAILGLGLTAILAAQAGAVSGAGHARYMSLAVGLGRCRMSEIEQLIERDGFQELDVTESGACCEDDESENISCTWKIEKPEFPEPALGELDLDTDLGSGQLGALGLLDQASQGEEMFTPGGGTQDVAEVLSGAGSESDLAAVAAGGVGGIASMVMSLVYPDLKRLFETASRRVTVTVTWTEGSRSYDITLVQWLTDPRQAGLVTGTSEDELSANDPLNGSSPPSPTSPRTPGPGSTAPLPSNTARWPGARR